MRSWCWHLLLAALVASYPLGDQSHLHGPILKQWNARPDPEKTGNLIFASVNGLLKVWPNSRHQNGHTIVAATIAPGTVLYHGRPDNKVPTTPEWLAVDPEYSFIFGSGEFYLLTIVATRQLRLAYFDGNSAAKIAGGTIDSQDVLVWGEASDDGILEKEGERIRALCAWGKPYGIDGYVRMSMAFEIMTCDFSDGLQVVSNRRIVPPTKPRFLSKKDPVIPLGWKGSLHKFQSAVFEMVEAGSWHNQSPGETRIKIDYSRVFTFYNPAFTSLVAARKHQTKDKYRVANISADDTTAAVAQVEEMFAREGNGSGIDWGSITQVVVDRYGGRLELVRHLLAHPGPRNVTSQAAEVRSQVLTMLTPYMLSDAIPKSTSGSRSWIAPIAEHCASTLTSWTPIDLFTQQEKLIKDAIDEVLHEICRVLSDIWVDAFGVEEASVEEVSRLLKKWRYDVDGLMVWLNWSIWDTCIPTCGPEEICYTPMWPWVPGGLGSYPPDPYGTAPRCISRVEPLSPLFDM